MLLLPPWDCSPYDRASPSRAVMGRRAAALERLAERASSDACLVVATVETLLQRLPPRAAWAGARLELAADRPTDALKIWLISNGYILDERVDEPGEAAFRGEVVDIFPSSGEEPVRIELADGRIGRLRRYDPVDQRTTGDVETLVLHPASEVLLSEDVVRSFLGDPKSAASDVVFGTPERPRRASGLEHRLPAFYDELETLFDYLPDAAVSFDPEVEERKHAALEQIADGYATRAAIQGNGTAAAGALPLEPRHLYLEEAEWRERLTGRSVVVFGAADDGDDIHAQLPEFLAASDPGRELARFVESRAKAGARIVLAAPDETGRDRLARLVERRIGSSAEAIERWADVSELPAGAVASAILDVGSGFALPELILIAAQDVGIRPVQAQTGAPTGDALLAASELRPGDLVVHADHGVARRCAAWSWSSRPMRAARRPSFSPSSMLALASCWRRCSRSIASGATAPKPPTSRSTAWAARTGRRARPRSRPSSRSPPASSGRGPGREPRRAGRHCRRLAPCIAASSPGSPSPRPVRQHLETFRRRFAGSEVRIEQLSRLAGGAEARGMRSGIADGSVRIAIGTQALLSEQVRFADLGLVIIDEEQRFGARQKEQLRHLRNGVHVLTLTATPIPRTLQSALVGLQDISVIATPPVRRRPVRTFVTPFDPAVVLEALRREAQRGGQSFVVCPRIQDLQPMTERLARLVPELDVVVAHGRMKTDALDEIMVRFAAGAHDVLLTTNIIESGLDIPNANTMLVWRADRFGLAQLHQLRGRVGRGARRAAIYLLTDPEKPLPPATEQRLRTLEALEGLGAGFAIGARDLDLRGAGDLLGEEQAGYVRVIGTELLERLLRSALCRVRGEADPLGCRLELQLDTAALIPADYVPEAATRSRPRPAPRRREALADGRGRLPCQVITVIFANGS